MGLFGKIKNAILKSTATKIATVAVAIAVIGGGAATLVYADVFTTPERAMEKATQEMEEFPFTYEEIFGFNALQKALEEKGTEFGFGLTVKDIPGDSLGFSGMTLPSLEFELISKATVDNKANVDLGLKSAETTLLSANVYADDEKIQVAVPKLFSAALTANYGSENFKEEFLNSYLLELLELSKEEVEEGWNLFFNDSSLEKYVKENGELLLKFASIGKTLEDGISYEKNGKMEIAVQDETLKCKVYTAIVEEEAFRTAMDEILSLVKEYTVELYSGVIEESEVLELYETVEEEFLDYYRDIKDITITTYVHNKRMAKQEMDFIIGETPGELDITYAVDGNPYENMEISVVLPVPEDEPVAFDYVIATEVDEDTYAMDWTVKAEEEEMVISFDYERLNGEFTAVFAMDGQSVELIGAVSELEKGKKIGLELESYRIKSEEDVEEGELNATMYVSVLEDEVKPLSGEEKDVLQMTEADFKALTDEITGNIMKVAFALMSLFE